MEFLGCTDELIAMLSLVEQSCEDQIVVVFLKINYIVKSF